VARERNVLQRAFEVAKDENFFEVCHLLENPVRGIKIEGSMYRRTRNLLPGEEERLVEAFDGCQGLNKFYGPLAMYLSLQTGMRLQEVANLRWNDVDFERRRITIRKSKTDKKLGDKGAKPGRIIVLPCDAMLALIKLWHHLNDEEGLPGLGTNMPLPSLKRPIDHPDSHIFINRYGKPMTPGALGDVFTDAVKRARLEPHDGEVLTFHDLRRAANMSFYQAGLAPEERKVMRGESDPSMDGVYRDLELDHMLRAIQDKLDRHVLKHVVLDENGKRKLDSDGKPILYGVTLEEYARVELGRKVTNLEIFKRNLSLCHLPRHTLAQLKAVMKKSEERLSQEKVAVWKSAADRTTLVPVGYLTKREAVKATKVSGAELLEIDRMYSGVLRENGYLIVSKTKLADELKCADVPLEVLISQLMSEPAATNVH
jgi:integrase